RPPEVTARRLRAELHRFPSSGAIEDDSVLDERPAHRLPDREWQAHDGKRQSGNDSDGEEALWQPSRQAMPESSVRQEHAALPVPINGREGASAGDEDNGVRGTELELAQGKGHREV